MPSSTHRKKQEMKRLVLALVSTSVVAAVAGTALAQTGGVYDLSWSTMDGGGAESSGGSYVLSGTIGQLDAAESAGGTYGLLGGFWPVTLASTPPSVPVPGLTSWGLWLLAALMMAFALRKAWSARKAEAG